MTSRLAPGGLQSVRGVKPDLTTLGKYIGGGMSFGAFGGRAEIMDLFDPRRPDALPHAGTFNNNVLTMTAGLTGLTEVYTPEAASRAERAWRSVARAAECAVPGGGCADAVHRHRLDARGAHDARAGDQSRADAAKGDPKLKELFFFDMLAQGIWLARRGMMTLSLPIGDAECEALVTAVEEFLSARKSLLE